MKLDEWKRSKTNGNEVRQKETKLDKWK